MRILLATVALLVALPDAAYAADILINNGDDCSNPANVIDDATYLFDTVHVRNVGCGTPDPGSPCPSPGDPTEVCVTWGEVAGGVVGEVHVYDSSSVTMSGGGVGELRSYASSTVTVSDGDVWGSLHAYDDSTATMSGGEIFDYLYAFNNSTVTMSGGYVAYEVGAHGSSIITMNNGTLDGVLYASNSSTVTMNGGTAGSGLYAGDSSTVTMNNGTVDRLYAGDSSTVTINGGAVTWDVHAGQPSTVTMTGGEVGGNLAAYDESSTIRVVGRDFKVDSVPVPYGDLTAQTGTLTGTLASGEPINNVFYQGGWTGTPCIVESPCTGTIKLVFGPRVPALPKWGYLALAGGLVVVGAAALRRRAAWSSPSPAWSANASVRRV